MTEDQKTRILEIIRKTSTVLQESLASDSKGYAYYSGYATSSLGAIEDILLKGQ
jgi:hypothetical protein